MLDPSKPAEGMVGILRCQSRPLRERGGLCGPRVRPSNPHRRSLASSSASERRQSRIPPPTSSPGDTSGILRARRGPWLKEKDVPPRHLHE